MTVDVDQLPQHMAALQAGNRVRMLRAQDCRKMRAPGGEHYAARLLDSLPAHWNSSRTPSGNPHRGRTSTVQWFLLNVRGFGPHRARALLDAVMHDLGTFKQINGARQIADLTVRERTAIAARLRATSTVRRDRAA